MSPFLPTLFCAARTHAHGSREETTPTTFQNSRTCPFSIRPPFCCFFRFVSFFFVLFVGPQRATTGAFLPTFEKRRGIASLGKDELLPLCVLRGPLFSGASSLANDHKNRHPVGRLPSKKQCKKEDEISYCQSPVGNG